MADDLVRLNAVHKAFKEKTVIEELSMAIGRGETVALCGGNGAGKSTLLRMLAGIMLPTRGSITVDGRSWREDRRRYARQIGYMPDDYRFSPGLTAMETMLFWARLRGLGKREAAEALSLVGLSDTGSKPVASFSKGMRQRVLFAQALLAKPPLIMMDEPTNGLDPYWMETFVGLVRKAAADGQTVLFSTHQLHIAEALADRIVFLQSGAVVLDGKTEDIRNDYGAAGLNEAFGELFGLAGSPPMERSGR
ncbi:ABC transporter ATP-binding protein [Paenibacillus arenilitoris]|uniref:ABC transporter ATP-binding protein n=1 Tax=Paenibacillus arenilitoris TaxID=2772299 RepID=A0A927CLX4_9BACL|nr:ABC transporter ATP-binding protein [Paenibacillus arenilitoris]MBD2869003.1 ABC transporter ATP-binding protein [Paenibacillus arenilitoris]